MWNMGLESRNLAKSSFLFNPYTFTKRFSSKTNKVN
jgi:hypothetical protein